MERNEHQSPPPYSYNQAHEPVGSRNPDHNVNQHRPIIKYEFTEEEKRVLNECKRDSFFQHCLPIAFANGLVVEFMAKKGYINRSLVRTGAAVFAGYIIGKLTYIPVCRRKIMEQIPNSELAKITQNKYNYYTAPRQPRIDDGQQEQQTPVYHSDDAYTNTNIDTNRPTYDLDSRPYSYLRPEDTGQPVKKSMTYDEIRQMNREKQKMEQIQQPSRTSQDFNRFPDRDRPLSPSFEHPQEEEKPRFQRRPFSEGYTNKYGDVWDK